MHPSIGAPAMTAGASSVKGVEPLQVAGQLLAVAAIALPGLGAVVRIVAFGAGDGGTTAVASGLAASIPELAIVGGLCFLLSVPAIAFVPIVRRYNASGTVLLQHLFHLDSVNGDTTDQDVTTKAKFIRRALVGIVVAIVLTAPGFPGVVIGLVVTLPLGSWYGSLADRGELTFHRTWPAFVVVLVSSAASLGLAGVVPTASSVSVSFTDESVLDHGDFVFLGHGNGMVHLVPCAGESHTILVRSEDILMMVDKPDPAPELPTLVEAILTWRFPNVGLVAPCD